MTAWSATAPAAPKRSRRCVRATARRGSMSGPRAARACNGGCHGSAGMWASGSCHWPASRRCWPPRSATACGHTPPAHHRLGGIRCCCAHWPSPAAREGSDHCSNSIPTTRPGPLKPGRSTGSCGRCAETSNRFIAPARTPANWATSTRTTGASGSLTADRCSTSPPSSNAGFGI